MSEEVRGREVTIHFDGKKCIHSRNCVLGRPDVFVPNVKGEWIHPDRATPADVAHLALACPSGAITWSRNDGAPAEAAPLVNTVHVRENGPLAFRGELRIAGQPAGYRATLCRCGASKNKPFCDGSHNGAGFAASGEPATAKSEALPVRNGALAVTPAPNGPLRVSGPHELVTGTGRTINRASETYLCRCGGSANKPYCDGSHKRNGFVG
ncbi:MAG TPA: CDGSH iron-sulfur domain-containing protein [Myxococcota bacterium]|nr:CDGSH iron-sulfur domain-containing protein [Myxococcota bacterium]